MPRRAPVQATHTPINNCVARKTALTVVATPLGCGDGGLTSLLQVLNPVKYHRVFSTLIPTIFRHVCQYFNQVKLLHSKWLELEYYYCIFTPPSNTHSTGKRPGFFLLVILNSGGRSVLKKQKSVSSIVFVVVVTSSPAVAWRPRAGRTRGRFAARPPRTGGAVTSPELRPHPGRATKEHKTAKNNTTVTHERTTVETRKIYDSKIRISLCS